MRTDHNSSKTCTASGHYSKAVTEHGTTSDLESIKYVVILLSYHGVMTQPSYIISNMR